MSTFRIAQPGEVTKETMVKRTTLDEKASNQLATRKIKLEHRTAGWAIAGSVCRWDNECWAVVFYCDGAEHGRRFNSEGKARELFERWTR